MEDQISEPNKTFFSWLYPLLQFGFIGCSEQLFYRGVFCLENSHCLFLLVQFGLSSIRSSVHIQIRFSNSLSSSFSFFYFSLLMFLRMRHFVSLLGTVTCGVHSVLFAGGSVRRQYCHGQSE